MPPKVSGTSLRGGKSIGKGFKLALPEPTIKRSSSTSPGSPTQAGASSLKPKKEGSSTQIVTIKPEPSTQEPPKPATVKQTKADYAFSDNKQISGTLFPPTFCRGEAANSRKCHALALASTASATIIIICTYSLPIPMPSTISHARTTLLPLPPSSLFFISPQTRLSRWRRALSHWRLEKVHCQPHNQVARPGFSFSLLTSHSR